MLPGALCHAYRLVHRIYLGSSCSFTYFNKCKSKGFQRHFSSLAKYKPLQCNNNQNGTTRSREAQGFQLAAAQLKSLVDLTTDSDIDNLIFDGLKEKEDDKVVVGAFLRELHSFGLIRTDPRLKPLIAGLEDEFEKQHGSKIGSTKSYIKNMRLDRETFKRLISSCSPIVFQAFREDLSIPDFETFSEQLATIFEDCRKVKGGKVATYIPQLAQMNPNYWGLSVCTVDGQRFSVGDTKVPFTIQSCSKPFTYALALHELGADTVHKYVGQEPSGRMFNELILDYNKKPHNPMVNAGAIIVCAVLKALVQPEMTLAEKFDLTYSTFKRLAGGETVGFNNAVFLSESACSDRNYALAHYMREHKCFPEGCDLKECMDYYFQCCSIEVNCESASVIAASIANGGVCPITHDKILKPDIVRDVLSLMHSCGMYDYSGQFAFKVGIPAKSGVSGAILLVIPNVMGITVFSPPLDSLGNSVRGVKFCQELVQTFTFDTYENVGSLVSKLDPRKYRFEERSREMVRLLFVAASGDVTSMRRYFKSGFDMEAVDYDGRTALHLAASEGHLECVKYLLEKCNVPWNPVDRWGNTPMFDAEHFGHSHVADFLKKWNK